MKRTVWISLFLLAAAAAAVWFLTREEKPQGIVEPCIDVPTGQADMATDEGGEALTFARRQGTDRYEVNGSDSVESLTQRHERVSRACIS